MRGIHELSLAARDIGNTRNAHSSGAVLLVLLTHLAFAKWSGGAEKNAGACT